MPRPGIVGRSTRIVGAMERSAEGCHIEPVVGSAVRSTPSTAHSNSASLAEIASSIATPMPWTGQSAPPFASDTIESTMAAANAVLSRGQPRDDVEVDIELHRISSRSLVKQD